MKKSRLWAFVLIIVAVFGACGFCLVAGSYDIGFKECFYALFGKGSEAAVRVIKQIRMPRMLAALIAGGGLSVSGLIMQTVLGNRMASPSTLGVSNAAVFGANLSIIVFAGGFLTTGKNAALMSASGNPIGVSATAFLFSVASVLVILGLCRMRAYTSGVLVLSGIAIGSMFSAATTLLQFYATDVGLSAAVIWSFGDLSRATYKTDLIMFVIVLSAVAFFGIFAWQYNALLSGTQAAAGLGVNIKTLRVLSLLIASLITAVCVSMLGIIGFVGIICPHIAKKIFGADHRISIPASVLLGSLLLLLADGASRCFGGGSVLPVGAITSLLGAPFFIAIILGGRRDRNA